MQHGAVPAADPDCAISSALGVVGQGWTLLVVRDVAGGLTRFDQLQQSLRIPRKTLTDRLALLVEQGVLERRPYSDRPPRFEYLLTDAGRGLLPVLIALQDWGTRHVLGDGTLTATSGPTSAEARRVHALVGTSIPPLLLTTPEGDLDPVDGWTVLYCFPGAFAPGADGYPPGWGDIPGTRGCTVESTTYRDAHPDLVAAGAAVRGISTQRTDQQRAFADHVGLPFPLLSDAELMLAGALRLPTFRVAGVDRLKRLSLLVGPDRAVRALQYPIADPAGSVAEMLGLLRSARR
jgi:DNA-binding HxlR family transcriptional regulator/peroxiredoxin